MTQVTQLAQIASCLLLSLGLGFLAIFESIKYIQLRRYLYFHAPPILFVSIWLILIQWQVYDLWESIFKDRQCVTLCPFFPFLHSAAWNMHTVTGALAAILYYEDMCYILRRAVVPWRVWLSRLSASLRTKGSLVQFPVRAHACVVGQVRPPVGAAREATTHWCFSLFLLPFLSL